MARYHEHVPSPQANDLVLFSTSPEYYVQVDGEADWNLADLNAAKVPFGHTVSRKTSTELQEASRRPDFAFISLTVDVVDFALDRTFTPVAGHVTSGSSFWCIFEFSEMQVKNDQSVAQLRSAIMKCDARRSLARERGTETTNFRALLATSKEVSKCLESHILFIQEEIEAIVLERNACIASVGRLRSLFICCR